VLAGEMLMILCVKKLSKLFIFTALSAPVAGAWAQTSNSSTSTSNTPPGSSVAVIPQKSLRQKLADQYSFSYYNWTAGPALDGNWDSTKSIKNQTAQIEAFHLLRAGYRINPNIDVGTQLRYDQLFTSRSADGQVIDGKDYQFLNPRFYVRSRNVIDNKLINMSFQGALEVPTTDTDKNIRKMTGAIMLQQGITFKVPSQKWSLSLGAIELFRHYQIKNKARNKATYVLYPTVSYNFTPVWGTQSYIQYTRNQKIGSEFHDSVRDLSDYFRVGATYTPNDWLQIYVPIQMFLYQPQMRTASLGLEISAGL